MNKLLEALLNEFSAKLKATFDESVGVGLEEARFKITDKREALRKPQDQFFTCHKNEQGKWFVRSLNADL